MNTEQIQKILLQKQFEMSINGKKYSSSMVAFEAAALSGHNVKLESIRSELHAVLDECLDILTVTSTMSRKVHGIE